jgi:hypothetical protein
LVDRRDALQVDLKTLNDQLAWLRDLQNVIPQLLTAHAKKDKQKQDELEARMGELKPWAGIQQDEQDPQKVGKLVDMSISKGQIALDAKRRELRTIDSEITNRLNSSAEKKAAQDFKTWMSACFAALIAIVIVGFFVTASRSNHVIEEIFHGRAGLQFITIFSLVIAIILFGITGVLEGKELSALLGGLAGYILGQSGAAGTGDRASALGQIREPATSRGRAAGGQEPQADAEPKAA